MDFKFHLMSIQQGLNQHQLWTVTPAPVMAAFSSIGPNRVTPEILKPDITAPRVSILADYTGVQGPTETDLDNHRVKFFVLKRRHMQLRRLTGRMKLPWGILLALFKPDAVLTIRTIPHAQIRGDGRNTVFIALLSWNDIALLILKGRNVWFLHQMAIRCQ
ncbi:hypothetical protein AABB24_005680 [Solanum stoloniferum]